MQQLTGLDASFLNMETPTTYGHVASLVLIDAATATVPVTLDSFRELLEARMHLVPPYRRKLVTVPFGIDHPYWIEDPDFDIEYHLREIAIPAPGNQLQLAEQVARICARPLDRSRPLWEAYLIFGIENGQVGLLTKIHHSAIDGVSGAEILATLLDLTPEIQVVPPPEKPWQPEAIPSTAEMLRRGGIAVVSTPTKMLRFQRKALQSLGLKGLLMNPAIAQLGVVGLQVADMITRMGGGNTQQPTPDTGEVVSRPPLFAPRTSFNTTITGHRRWAYGSVSLEEVKAVKNAFGVTVNDVVLALCAGALRSYLLKRDELPADPLLAMVPVSIRTEDEKGAGGNRVLAMVASLATHEADPVKRLRSIHDSMAVAKNEFKAIPADLLTDFTQFATPAIAARAARVAARARLVDRINLPFNVVISNVPGPTFPIYCGGAQVTHTYPISAITDGVGLNMTVMSYLGGIDFGLVACRELMPDLWELMDGIHESLAELQKAAPEKAPANVTPAKRAGARKKA